MSGTRGILGALNVRDPNCGAAPGDGLAALHEYRGYIQELGKNIATGATELLPDADASGPGQPPRHQLLWLLAAIALAGRIARWKLCRPLVG